MGLRPARGRQAALRRRPPASAQRGSQPCSHADSCTCISLPPSPSLTPRTVGSGRRSGRPGLWRSSCAGSHWWPGGAGRHVVAVAAPSSSRASTSLAATCLARRRPQRARRASGRAGRRPGEPSGGTGRGAGPLQRRGPVGPPKRRRLAGLQPPRAMSTVDAPLDRRAPPPAVQVLHLWRRRHPRARPQRAPRQQPAGLGRQDSGREACGLGVM